MCGIKQNFVKNFADAIVKLRKLSHLCSAHFYHLSDLSYTLKVNQKIAEKCVKTRTKIKKKLGVRF